jgi:opacity protein-like surface antigen
MNRLIATLTIVLLFLPTSSARADITQKYSVNYMRPYNTDAGKIGESNFGASWEMEFHLEGIPDYISWGAGLDWVDMLGERSSFWDSGGTPFVHELDQNYFLFWFGPRLRSHNQAPLRLYAGAQLALIYYEYSSSLYIPGNDPTPIESDHDFALGYGLHGGVEFRVAPGWSIDLGLKYLKTFGEPRQLSFDSVTVYPSHLLYQIGVRFTGVE